MTLARPLALALVLAGVAHADHEQAFPIVKDKGLCERGGSNACRYLRVSECAGIYAPLPRLAQSEAAPCPNGDPAGCLPNGNGGAYLTFHGGVIVLPKGNDRWLEHELIHHARCWLYGDCSSHEGPEWACDVSSQ